MNNYRNQLGKLLFVFVLIISLYPILNWNITANAEGALDPAPEITPITANGKKVLFDNTHGQTAGAADWVIDGAFSDFAEGIANKGYYVKELRKTTAITYEDLLPYDVFVIPEANIPFKKTEQDAMLRYTESGGSIFFISDHYNADRNKNRWDSSEVMNGYRRGAWEDPAKGMSTEESNSEAMQGIVSSDWLSDHFGIRFRYNAIGDVSANIIAPSQDVFGITAGVNTVAMHAGSTLMVTDPTKAKGLVHVPTNIPKWNFSVDQGVYFNGGIDEGPYAAISKLGQGKAGFIGDSSPVEDATPKYLREENGQTKKTYDGFKEADDAVLLLNMIEWLAAKESYSTFTETGIPLDQVSPQLEMEIPAQSTEPQPEPWSQPAAGYKWYDQTTFANGSYGSSVAALPQPIYTFNHGETLPNKQVFKIKIQARNLNPGQVVSDLNLGIYNPVGGAQIAKVQNANGTWPAVYGYSENISITADALGNISKEVSIELNPDYEGEARLRLRNGKTNIVTTNVSVGNVATLPLPEENVDFINITEAKQQIAGTEVIVKGVITSTPGLLGSKGFYIQDESAGIYVYQSKAGFELGDQVKITAKIGQYNNEYQLNDITSIENLGKVDLPKAEIVTEINEANQGRYVKLENGLIEKVSKKGKAIEMVIKADGKQINIRIEEGTKINYNEFKKTFRKGDTIHISGIASVYKNVYQMKLLSLDDIEKVSVSMNSYKEYKNNKNQQNGNYKSQKKHAS